MGHKIHFNGVPSFGKYIYNNASFVWCHHKKCISNVLQVIELASKSPQTWHPIYHLPFKKSQWTDIFIVRHKQSATERVIARSTAVKKGPGKDDLGWLTPQINPGSEQG